MVNLTDFPSQNPKPLQPGQFSQGTLFQQPKPSAEHRWAAHGYSPERRDAIREALPLKNIGVSSKFWGKASTRGSSDTPSIEDRGRARSPTSGR